MIVVKLGGSILTNKGSRGRPRFRRAIALRLVRELRGGEPFVLIHGAGSFAHPLALRYGIGSKRLSGSTLATAVARTQRGVRELRHHMLAACVDAGVDPFDVPAAVAFHDGTTEPSLWTHALNAGLIPVTGGDVVFDRRLGARVLSGDEIATELTRRLKPRLVVFVSDVDGIRVGRQVAARLDVAQARKIKSTIEAGSDATGGMRGKLEQALEIATQGTPVAIVNGERPGRLRALVRGQDVVATWIR